MSRAPGDRAAAQAELLRLGRTVKAMCRYFSAGGLPTWDQSETYHAGDIVRAADGRIYQASDPTTGEAPGDGVSSWAPFGRREDY